MITKPKTSRKRGTETAQLPSAPLPSTTGMAKPKKTKKRRTRKSVSSAAAPALAAMPGISPSDAATITMIFTRSVSPQLSLGENVRRFNKNVELISKGFTG